jgi:hypothetical protein
MDKKKLRSMVSVVRADEKRKECIKNNEMRHSKNLENRHQHQSPDYFLTKSLKDWAVHQNDIKSRQANFRNKERLQSAKVYNTTNCPKEDLLKENKSIIEQSTIIDQNFSLSMTMNNFDLSPTLKKSS